jgi:polyisoprenyl-teichoic acid--peptidoglycan teichoic acid transferase
VTAPDEVVPARPRRWPRRLLIGLNVFLAVCVLATGAAYAYVSFQFGRIDEISLGDVLPKRPAGVEESPGNVMNVLLVGSDSRENISAEERKSFDDRNRPVTGQRSDTIMILHVDPKATKASILSVPRDLYVPIAGTEGRDGRPRTRKINTAFEGPDGPANLIRTLENNLKIDIDHYLQVDFNGFRGIVETVGGVDVYFPAPARDRLSGLLVKEAGCVQLDGNGALAYVRSRHYESQDDRGRWRSEGGIPDFNRINRQQDFIRRVMGRRRTPSPPTSSSTRPSPTSARTRTSARRTWSRSVCGSDPSTRRRSTCSRCRRRRCAVAGPTSSS